MVNERLQGNEAVFFRVLQHGDVAQTALVLLNKGDQARTLTVAALRQSAAGAMHWTAVRCRWMPWRPKCPHTAKVYVLDAAVQQPALQAELTRRWPTSGRGTRLVR